MTFLSEATTLTKKTTICHSSILKKCNSALHTDSLTTEAVELYPTHTVNSSLHSGRSCLYTSHPARGSVTIEAAIAVPVFLFALLSIIYVINIMHLQMTVQIALEEAARNISKTAYISSEFYALTTDSQAEADKKDSSLVENIGAALVTVPYIKNVFLDESIKRVLDNSYVTNGSDGISFLLSSVDLDDNIVDIVLTYEVSIPFLPDNVISFKLSNRCYTRMYMGLDMDKEQQEDYIYVYYTTYGKVLHTNKYCRYLLNYSEALRYNDAMLTMNPEKCLLCGLQSNISQLKKDNPIVYLSSDHEVYHITLDCQAFTKDVFRQKRTSVDTDDICEECLKGK